MINYTFCTFRVQRSIFSLDNCYSVEPPKVTLQSRVIYQANIDCAKDGPIMPINQDLALYQQYAYSQYNYRG